MSVGPHRISMTYKLEGKSFGFTFLGQFLHQLIGRVILFHLEVIVRSILNCFCLESFDLFLVDIANLVAERKEYNGILYVGSTIE
jgi:hypothetical protein